MVACTYCFTPIVSWYPNCNWRWFCDCSFYLYFILARYNDKKSRSVQDYLSNGRWFYCNLLDFQSAPAF